MSRFRDMPSVTRSLSHTLSPCYARYGEGEESGRVLDSTESTFVTTVTNREIRSKVTFVTGVTTVTLVTAVTARFKKTGSRSRNFDGGESVEVDAISPTDLRAFVEAGIVPHIDKAAKEMLERDTLARMINGMDGARGAE